MDEQKLSKNKIIEEQKQAKIKAAKEKKLQRQLLMVKRIKIKKEKQ